MKRLTLFAGHYGSGKTSLAVNYAVMLKDLGLPVMLADLDIVNPYFRAADYKKEFDSLGIELLVSPYACSNLDFPALTQSFYALTDSRDKYGVLDIGGDDRGALVLGRYRDAVLEEDNYEFLFVLNKFRPLTSRPELALKLLRETEAAAGIKFTGIVNNSNLGELTRPCDVTESLSFARELERISGVPLKFTSAAEKIYGELNGKIPELKSLVLQKKIYEEM